MNDHRADSFSIDFDQSLQLSFCSGETSQMLQPPILNVYLAGPLTNNDQATNDDCKMVRDVTKRLFEAYDHQGVRFEVYDPGSVTQPGSDHSPEEVYELDHRRTMTADLVVFHVNVPSLGVGIESQIAANGTIPRVVVSRKGVVVSRMFAGLFSPTLAAIEYENQADYASQLALNLLQIAIKTVESATKRRPLVEEFKRQDIGRVIQRQRIIKSIPLSALAEQAAIREHWLRQFEQEPEVAASFSQIAMLRIADVCGCCVRVVRPRQIEVPILEATDDTLTADENASLDNLLTYVRSSEEWLSDNRVFRLWEGYRAELAREAAEAIEYRDGGQRVVTVEDWRRRDQRPDKLFE